EESDIDLSALDEKFGKSVAEALSMMIHEAVVQGITAVLPEIVKTVRKNCNLRKKHPPGSPWIYYDNHDPNMDGDDMPRCLDLLFRPTKEMKFFNKELTIAAYIFGNNMDPKEVLVPNDHCSGTRKTLLTIIPGKPIIGDVLTLVCSMLTKRYFGPKENKYANQWFQPSTFSQIVLSPKQNCVRTMKYIKDNFMGDIATLHQ
ncbi:hypothetical protein S83_019494, partial [Arachis hypogaea]